MTEKKNTWLGFLSLLASMILYAFSGIVVVGLSAAFGSIGQVTFRALAAIVLTLVWLMFTGFKYRLTKQYDKKWLYTDLLLRPIFNICFVYAVLAINPTAALFYLFAAKVVAGMFIKLASGEADKFGKTDIAGFVMVIAGLFVFSFPLGSSMSAGVIIAMISGVLEAIKSRAMEKLTVSNDDKPVVALYEFVSLGIISAAAVMIFGQTFLTATITLSVWKVLVLSAFVAVPSLFLELYGFANFDSDLGNAILASEMGIAGILNYIVLGTVMSAAQIVGSSFLVVSLFVVYLASYFRNKS